MTWTSPDRWSCPDCRQTVVFEGSPEAVACQLRKAQEDHGKRHLAERVAVVRLEIALPRRKHRRRAA